MERTPGECGQGEVNRFIQKSSGWCMERFANEVQPETNDERILEAADA